MTSGMKSGLRPLPALAIALAALGCSVTGGELDAPTLARWHAVKAAGGPTYAGSPAWRSHVSFVERELARRGVTGIARQSFEYPRWHLPRDGRRRVALAVAGQSVPVASVYAYSGDTGPRGVTAPLVRYTGQDASELAGRIVVFEVPPLPDPVPAMFGVPRSSHTTAPPGDDPDGIATRQWYQANYPTRFGRYGRILARAGAAGGIIVFGLGPERVRGLYTFPLLDPGLVGVPALYLDRDAGAAVLEAAGHGDAATLVLDAEVTDSEAWFLHGVLPGRDHGTARDELVLLVTHTDGPNLTQENGGLAMLGIIDILSRVPRAERRRSVLVLLDPQHYMPGRHLVDWYAAHPGIAARIVASIGVEQLGQLQYEERGDEFRPNGLPEPAYIYVQDNDALLAAAIGAAQRHALPRTWIRVPPRGEGFWAGLGDVALKRRLPGYGFSTGMSGYWAEGPGMESFDARLCLAQVRTLADLTLLLVNADEPLLALPARRRP